MRLESNCTGVVFEVDGGRWAARVISGTYPFVKIRPKRSGWVSITVASPSPIFRGVNQGADIAGAPVACVRGREPLDPGRCAVRNWTVPAILRC